MKDKNISMVMDGNFLEFEGKVYSPHMNYDAFLSRFTDSFQSVNVVARAFPKKELSVGLNEVCRHNSSFTSLCSTRGAIGFFKSLSRNITIISKAIDSSDIVLIRFPGNIAILAMLICLIKRKIFSVELVAEPKDYFSSHSSKSIFRSFFGLIHTKSTLFAANRSKVVRYVTKNYLQNRYPTKGISFGFSDVYLPLMEPQSKTQARNYNYDLVSVAMMHNHSKGHTLLIDALSELLKNGQTIKACFIGDGKLRGEFELYAKTKNVYQNIDFVGPVVDRDYFYSLLKSSKFFVLPSFQEGMPRALLEAVNAGLVAISSNVGGIPEVLSMEATFDAGDLYQLTNLIQRCSTDSSFLELLRDQQLEAIKEFSDSYLSEKTHEYCSVLKKVYCDAH